MGFGIRNTAQGIWNPANAIGIRNPNSTDKISEIHSVVFRIQDCLGIGQSDCDLNSDITFRVGRSDERENYVYTAVFSG